MKVNLVRSVAKTIDDFLDNIGLGRPAEKIVDFFESTAPSRLAKKAGLPPAPGEVVDQVVGSALYEMYKARLPKPFKETFEEIRKRVERVTG